MRSAAGGGDRGQGAGGRGPGGHCGGHVAGRRARSTVEAAAEATIARIEADIDDSELKAPRDGRVQYRVAQPGEVLAAGGKVLNLVDLTDVYMTFFLPETVAGKVALGSEVHLVLDAAPAVRDSGQGVVRGQHRAVHAEDGGNRQRAAEADVPRQGADRSASCCKNT